jgi:hypothetical protein
MPGLRAYLRAQCCRGEALGVECRVHAPGKASSASASVAIDPLMVQPCIARGIVELAERSCINGRDGGRIPHGRCRQRMVSNSAWEDVRARGNASSGTRALPSRTDTAKQQRFLWLRQCRLQFADRRWLYMWWSNSCSAMRVSRARLASDAVKNARASTKSAPTPYSCATLKYALTNATITSMDVVIAANVENKMALFNNTARRFSRGISTFRWALKVSPSVIACNACDRSIIRFIRPISTEVNDATAPNKKAGAVT